MTRSFIARHAFFLLLAVAMVGCRANAPLPLPDAARADGLVLLANPNRLVIRPGSSGRIRFELRDEQNLPVPDYPVAFAIVGDETVMAGTRLSAEQSMTGADGAAEVEVIVDVLTSEEHPVFFSVQADCQDSVGTRADIVVTTNTYSVKILPVPADDLLGSESIVATKLSFYDNTPCADLDLHDLDNLPKPARDPVIVAANDAFPFEGVSGRGAHAVVGLGLDSAGVVQIGGCADVPGSALLEFDTIRAILFMDHLFPVPHGRFDVASDFRQSLAPAALTAVGAAWQQWARCPFDPARLWIDCTIAALRTDGDANADPCAPAAGTVGFLGERLLAARGTTVTPLATTPASPSDTACHGATDSDGNPSLEYAVDALFAGTRDQLTATNLAGFPSEIATLLDAIRIDSQMSISQADDANSYWVEHRLVAVTFPNALVPVTLVPASFPISKLGLPVTKASNIIATLKADQLSIPSHAFTLRLGTNARYAFEATSLKTRNARDSAELVETMFGMAQLGPQEATLSGCAALDAVACDAVKYPRGCLLAACQAGLTALARKLVSAFDSLDGDGYDFLLSGWAPAIDLDGDGQADALGVAGSSGNVFAGPGLWSAVVEARSGSNSTYGSWTASRSPSSP
jgi:hypothetical protein